jgi:ABC-type transporter Mla MlaB component
MELACKSRASPIAEALVKPEMKNTLFRIAIDHAHDVDTWTLQGKLAGQVVSELITAWRKTRSERTGRKCVIDLVDLTCVDESGEQALMEMMADGVEFAAKGVYTKGLLENLAKPGKRRG